MAPARTGTRASTATAAAPGGGPGRATDGGSGVTVALGPEDLLADRVVEVVVAAARAADPDTEREVVEGPGLSAGTLAGLLSPSLFTTSRVVVVAAADQLGAEAADALLDAVAELGDGYRIVVRHPGGARGRGVVDRLRRAGATVVACDRPRPGDLPGFVADEIRRSGGTVTRDAAVLLVDAVGADLRALSAAGSQLVADAPDNEAGDGSGGRRAVDRALVATYYGGHAQVSGFQIADAALEGRTADALDRLRWALRSGVAPVLLVSAFATGVRSLLRLSGLRRGASDGEAAQLLGVPPWKVRSVRGQSAGWPPAALLSAQVAVADADAAVKGAGADPGFAIERLLLRLADLRETPARPPARRR